MQTHNFIAWVFLLVSYSAVFWHFCFDSFLPCITIPFTIIWMICLFFFFLSYELLAFVLFCVLVIASWISPWHCKLSMVQTWVACPRTWFCLWLFCLLSFVAEQNSTLYIPVLPIPCRLFCSGWTTNISSLILAVSSLVTLTHYWGEDS